MLFAAPFSAAFWACYLCAGASDLLDGPVAKALKTQSAAGAGLDSAADVVFAAAIAVFTAVHIALPLWMWRGVFLVAALRFIGYGVGFHKYRAFSSLHTYANKATGALVFAFPLLHRVLGMPVTGVILLAVALVSSAEELIITLRAKTLSRDCKGLFPQLFDRLRISS